MYVTRKQFSRLTNKFGYEHIKFEGVKQNQIKVISGRVKNANPNMG